MRDFSQDHRWLSINTATLRQARGVEQTLENILAACARKQVRAVSPWRDQVMKTGLKKTAALLEQHGLELSGYCRGGLFPAVDEAGLRAAYDENRRAVDEACELHAKCLVLVAGALPGALEGRPAHKDIARSREQVAKGMSRLLEYAGTCGLPLAIEPLHPMYAADRACVNTLEHALDLCDQLDPFHSGSIGVAVDVYHVWWDPKLEQQIARAGKGRLLAFHVCDWLVPTTDLLNDRGMMGDGVIDIPKIRGWMEAQGYEGYCEVEIFSTGNWWQKETDEVLDVCIERHKTAV